MNNYLQSFKEHLSANSTTADATAQFVSSVEAAVNMTITAYPPVDATATNETMSELLNQLGEQYTEYLDSTTHNYTGVSSVVGDIRSAILNSILETYSFSTPENANAGSDEIAGKSQAAVHTATLIVSFVRSRTT